jgi:hypothetical protein
MASVQIVPGAASDIHSPESEKDHELLELDKLLRYTRQNATEGQTRHARQVSLLFSCENRPLT